MTDTAPEQPPAPTPPRTSGILHRRGFTVSGLARALCEAMDAAGIIDEPVINWRADPATKVVTFSAEEDVT